MSRRPCNVYVAEARAERASPALAQALPIDLIGPYIEHVTRDGLFRALREAGREIWRTDDDPSVAVTWSELPRNVTTKAGLAHLDAQHIELHTPASACTVLHELAHLCRPDGDHDQLFASAYLQLVRRWAGEHAAETLAHELKHGGVL